MLFKPSHSQTLMGIYFFPIESEPNIFYKYMSNRIPNLTNKADFLLTN